MPSFLQRALSKIGLKKKRTVRSSDLFGDESDEGHRRRCKDYSPEHRRCRYGAGLEQFESEHEDYPTRWRNSTGSLRYQTSGASEPSYFSADEFDRHQRKSRQVCCMRHVDSNPGKSKPLLDRCKSPTCLRKETGRAAKKVVVVEPYKVTHRDSFDSFDEDFFVDSSIGHRAEVDVRTTGSRRATVNDLTTSTWRPRSPAARLASERYCKEPEVWNEFELHLHTVLGLILFINQDTLFENGPNVLRREQLDVAPYKWRQISETA